MAQKNDPNVIRAEGSVRNSRADVRTSLRGVPPEREVSAGAAAPAARGPAHDLFLNGQEVNLPLSPGRRTSVSSANVDVFTGGARFFELRQSPPLEGALA
jgi:hypothetical protein